jgi:hypothetical protein
MNVSSVLVLREPIGDILDGGLVVSQFKDIKKEDLKEKNRARLRF